MSSGRNKATLLEPDGPEIAILGYGVSSSKTVKAGEGLGTVAIR